MNIFRMDRWRKVASYKAMAIMIGALTGFVGCKKSPYIEEGQIKELTKNRVDELKEVRAYDVSPETGVEQIAVYKSADSYHIALFQKEGGDYSFLRDAKLDPGYAPLKMIFINPGITYSHIIVLSKSESGYALWLIDSHRLLQKMELSRDDVEKIFIDKEEGRSEEILRIGEISYRFDSFAYIPLNETRPLFFLETFDINGKDSMIVLKNKGKFTSSALITIGFPDISPEDAPNKVGLVANIPTVHYYAAGSSVFKRGGGKTTTNYPMIEIEKIPFGSHYSMKLPLFLGENIGRVYIRIVYKYRGKTVYWPDPSQKSDFYDRVNPAANAEKSEKVENIVVRKTQQGYLAYEYTP